MSRLLSSQVSAHNGSKVFCLRCLSHFSNKEKLAIHEEYCWNNDAQIQDMPEKGSFIIFKNHNHYIKVPFAVYADFESFTKEICEPKGKNSFKYQRHKPSGFCYYVKCFDDKIFQPVIKIYTAKSADEGIAQKIVEMLEKDIKLINKKFDFSKKMIPLTEEEKFEYEKATVCWICQEKFYKCGECDECHKCDVCDKKVRDHCHYTRKYRGAAHNHCNLQFRKPKFTPVFFHNLAGYDSHLFVKDLGKSEGNINCILCNEEKYISFSKQIVVGEYKDKNGIEKKVKHQIRFIDSMKFMASSLESLVKNLPKEKFKNISRYYQGDQLKLLLRKGVFPYDWFNSFDKLEAENLPPKECFYSKLNEVDISKKDYQHAQKVWEKLKMKKVENITIYTSSQMSFY